MPTNIHIPDKHGVPARLFFALWPSAELRRRLHALALRYQRLHGGRAMRAETLHLTLLFLGEVPRAQIASLLQAIDGERQ